MKREIFVVIAERDCVDPFDSTGAVVFETNVVAATLSNAVERARTLGQRYGQLRIGKVELIGTPEEAEHMLRERKP